MKVKTMILVALIGLICGCKNNYNEGEVTTEVLIEENKINFGTISKSDSIVRIFSIKNIGSNPLFINDVKAGCNCTIPIWTKKAILPDSVGEITVKFKPNEGQEGYITNSIVLNANTDSIFHVLYIEGNIN